MDSYPNSIIVQLSNTGPQGAPGPAGMIPVAAITSSENPSPYTAAANSQLSIFSLYNTSGSVYIFNLPQVPAENQILQVIDSALTSSENEIIIQGNGNPICAYGAIGSAASINSNGGSLSLCFDGLQWVQNG